jgi:hypothetical protein
MTLRTSNGAKSISLKIEVNLTLLDVSMYLVSYWEHEAFVWDNKHDPAALCKAFITKISDTSKKDILNIVRNTIKTGGLALNSESDDDEIYKAIAKYLETRFK